MPFGVMGADFSRWATRTSITNMVDYGMDVQQAIDAPRVFYVDETTEVERGVPEATIAGLKSARARRACSARCRMAAGRAIVIDWERGVLIGGSDPRKDGCAIGY